MAAGMMERLDKNSDGVIDAGAGTHSFRGEGVTGLIPIG